jgi:hypothetical protein
MQQDNAVINYSKYIRPSVITLYLLSLFLSSCSVDKKIGKDFLESPPPIQILLLPPNDLYKYNHKGEAIAGFDSLGQAQQDSALFFSSRFIRNINDSAFLENYVNNFLGELRRLGFTVYLPDAVDSLLKEQPQVYVLNMAQLQLDEYLYPFDDEIVYYGTRYIKSLDLDAVDFSSWYEVSKMNTTNPRKTVLYATHSMTDGVDGNFFLDAFTDEVKYRYQVDSVTLQDIQSMAVNLGRRHASYLFDFFLNQYIAYNMPAGEIPYWYYHYNRFDRRLEPAEEDRFQVLNND